MSKKDALNISEIPPDKKLVLSKFNFTCDDIDESIPLPLPQMLNFFMLICGRPGSGKRRSYRCLRREVRRGRGGAVGEADRHSAG